MAVPKNVHMGHRDRLRTRFMENGLGSFEEHQILELLLFYAIPRRDTNGIAHILLQHFGSLEKVLSATEEEWKDLKASDSMMLYFSLLRAACDRYYQNKYQNEDETENCFSFSVLEKYISEYFGNVAEEQFLLLLTNPQGVCQFREIVHRGAVLNETEFIRSVLQQALSYHASHIILIHRLAENSVPSQEHLDFSYLLQENCRLVGMRLVDYILYTGSSILSTLSPDAEEEITSV